MRRAQPGQSGVGAAEHFPQLGIGNGGRGIIPHGGGQGIFDHFIGHIRRGVVSSLRLFEGNGAAGLRRRNQSLEQIAQQFRIQGLLAFPRPMFIHRPVVAGKDGKKAGPGRVRMPIGGIRQIQAVILAMLGKKGAVEKGRPLHRPVKQAIGMIAPLLSRDIQPLMKEKAQNFPVVLVGGRQGGLGKGLLEQLSRDQVFLFQNPGEHQPHQMAQDGLALRPALAGLPVGRPAGDFPIELLTEGGRFQRQQQLLGAPAGGRRPVQQLQQLLGGGPGRGRGQSGVKGGGHIDLPLGRHR